jgi:hypothetical protein
MPFLPRNAHFLHFIAAQIGIFNVSFPVHSPLQKGSPNYYKLARQIAKQWFDARYKTHIGQED